MLIHVGAFFLCNLFEMLLCFWCNIPTESYFRFWSIWLFFCLNDLILVTLLQHHSSHQKFFAGRLGDRHTSRRLFRPPQFVFFIYCSLHFYGFPFICLLRNIWAVVNVFLIPINNSNNNNNINNNNIKNNNDNNRYIIQYNVI